METIAIYWEKQVKVYGILLKSDLFLMRLQLGNKKLLPWHNLLTQFETSPISFELITSLPDATNNSVLSVIVDKDQQLSFHNNLKERQDKQQTTFTVSYEKVELIYLHGPHFQERFGILARALEPLDKLNIEPIVTGCSGNSMYIAVPDGQGTRGTTILQSTFRTPSSV